MAKEVKSCGWCGHILEKDTEICPICSTKYIPEEILRKTFEPKIWKGSYGILMFLIPIWSSLIFLFLAEIEKKLMHTKSLASLSFVALFLIPAIGAHPILRATNVNEIHKLIIALIYYFVNLLVVFIIGTWVVFTLDVYTGP